MRMGKPFSGIVDTTLPDHAYPMRLQVRQELLNQSELVSPQESNIVIPKQESNISVRH